MLAEVPTKAAEVSVESPSHGKYKYSTLAGGSEITKPLLILFL